VGAGDVGQRIARKLARHPEHANRSIWNDLRLILRTVPLVLFRSPHAH
jgi:lipopolysaccharide/colanic/teichoic acid biosynthesis glycosyltransferase